MLIGNAAAAAHVSLQNPTVDRALSGTIGAETLVVSQSVPKAAAPTVRRLIRNKREQ
jgi:hypothetical protein